jgi:predicted alpha/beta-fold hydrolase
VTIADSQQFGVAPFLPRRGMRNAHAQTIFSWLLTRESRLPPSEERLFSVEPEVQVVCRCNWQSEPRRTLTLVLVHGLEGSTESQYIVGTANKAWDAGFNVVRMNMRNCGGSERLGPTLYHSGLSADVGAVVRALIEQDGLPHVALCGFSMGGNLVLKLAGELGRDSATPPELVGVCGVSAAMDLGPSADALHRKANRVYELNFVKNLRRSTRRKAALFPGRYDTARLRGVWSVRKFDDVITAPYSGFRDADDYYHRASAARVLEAITVPALVVHAADDPFIRVLPETRTKLAANPNISFVETAHGGHCGFLADPIGYDGRWAERLVVQFAARGLLTSRA